MQITTVVTGALGVILGLSLPWALLALLIGNDPDGIYGKVSWQAMTAYLLGVAVEIPFMSTTFYTGPMVAHLGGADIAWIVGLIVTSVTYFILGRSLPAPPERVTAFATEQGVTS